MAERGRITTLRPPSYVSRETGAAELDMTWSQFDLLVRAGVFGEPNDRGLWRFADIDESLQAGRGLVGTVYFVGFDDYVKIGFTTMPVEKRVERLQTGSPKPLRVLATQLGCTVRERGLHTRFADLRLHGEWFRNEGPLADYIDGLAK